MGSGRSDMTVFFHHLSSHPQLCWFSNHSNHLNWMPMMSATQCILKVGLPSDRKHTEDDFDPVELIGLHLKFNVEEILQLDELVGTKYKEVRYEDLVQNLRGTTSEVIGFLERDKTDDWLNELPVKLPNMNEKWRTDLSERQVELLQDRISGMLKTLNYDI
jgi:hypothetical protein